MVLEKEIAQCVVVLVFQASVQNQVKIERLGRYPKLLLRLSNRVQVDSFTCGKVALMNKSFIKLSTI